MDDSKWRIAKRVFGEALALPAEQRAAWVEAQCEDTELRREIHELLAAHDDNVPADAPPEIPPAEGPGATIDRYKLLQQIGEGGFGVVYMAAQTDPVERRVALKIIKPGMDSGQIIARFEAERQALALMDHPNIAKVLDAGATATGQPYFVMELVKGIPITEYCEQHQLPPKRRLELFIHVCQGVQHAHQKGIIHRDLKPSNVLVAEYDNRAVPKIIDFGVAKATSHTLTEKTVFTEFGQLVGTLEYMSPEQAKLNQLDIDTRSDVYSLGVLLYELLTGTTPFPRDRLYSAAFEEMLRIIREEAPPKPSTRVSTLVDASPAASRDPEKLSRLLRGDLDWIVMRSLDKERNRRYESAGSFAADLERYLEGEAVEACPPSATYRLRKFIRRHRGAVIAASLLMLALALGLVGTSVGLLQAKEAQRDAVEARDSERYLNFRMAFDRGQALCDEGRVGHGMLWLTRALEIAPAGDTAMRRAIRANLNAWRQELNSLEMIFPHDAPVICVAFDPSGDMLLSGSNDGKAQLWDARTGERIRQPLPHDGNVHELAFSADGSRILTTALDTTTFLWDAKTGEQLVAFRSPDGGFAGSTFGGAFRPPDDAQVVTSYADGTVMIWDAASGTPVGNLQPANHAVHDIAVSADGSRILAACHDGTAQLWDLDSRELLATFHHGAHERVASADYFGADESQVVTGCGDGSVYLWNVADALADADRKLEVSAREFAAHWKHGGFVHRLRVGPDGARILTASFDTTSRLLTVDGNRAPFEHHAAVQGVAFHPDGSRVATACDDELARVWRPAAGASVRRVVCPRGFQEAVYSPGGRYVLTKPEEATARVSDTATGARICEFAHAGGIRAMAVSADGSLVLTGSAKAATRLWDVATGELRHELGGKGSSVWTVAFSPDGARALVGDFDGSVEAYDVKTGDPIGEPMALGSRVQGIAFSPDGSQMVIVGDDRLGRIFDTDDPTTPRLLSGHRSTVSVAAFSLDGSRVVTGSFDNTARVWDAATAQPLSDAMPHGGPISFVSTGFSRDGRLVVIGCVDGSARVWDVATSRPIGPALRHETAVHMAAFSSESQVITGSTAGTVRFWDAPTSPLQGGLERIAHWIQVATGFELDDEGSLHALDAESWKQRRARLDELGGPPRGR